MLLVQGELGVAHQIAPVVVPEERLGSVGDPFHRPPEVPGREGAEDLLRVERVLASESTPHVLDEHPDTRFLDTEDRGELPPHAVRHLGRDVQGPALPVVRGDRAAGLQGAELGAVVDDAPPHDSMRRRERGVGRRRIPDLPAEGDVVGDVVPDRRPARRLVAGGDGGKAIVVDLDSLARVERLPAGLRNHEGDALADEADAVAGEGGLVPLAEAVALLKAGPGRLRGRRHAGDSGDAGRREVPPRVDRAHAGCRARRRRVDAPDPGVGEGRPQNHRVEGAGWRPVVDEAPFAAQQPRVLAA